MATWLVGQFSRLDSETAGVVVAVEALVVVVAALGVELHAARSTADAARADNTATPPRRPWPALDVAWARTAEGRVDMTGEAPFDWNCGNPWGEAVSPSVHRAPTAGRQPAVIRFSR